MHTTLYIVGISNSVAESLSQANSRMHAIACTQEPCTSNDVYLFEDSFHTVSIQPLTLSDIQTASANFTLFLNSGGRLLLDLSEQVSGW